MTPSLRYLDKLPLLDRYVLQLRPRNPKLAQESADVLDLRTYMDGRRKKAKQEGGKIQEERKLEYRAAYKEQKEGKKNLRAMIGLIASTPESTSLSDCRYVWTTEIGPEVDRRVRDGVIFARPDRSARFRKEYAAAGARYPEDAEPDQVEFVDEYVEKADMIRTEMIRLEAEAEHVAELHRIASEPVDIYEIEAKQAALEADYFTPGTVVDASYDWPLMPHDVVARLNQRGILTNSDASTAV